MDETTKENLVIAVGVGVAAGALYFITREWLIPWVEKTI